MEAAAGEWLMMAVWYFGQGLIYGSLLAIAILLISEALAAIRRWRSKLAGERLLDTIPDIPYHPLPDNDVSPSSCVICIEEYCNTR